MAAISSSASRAAVFDGLSSARPSPLRIRAGSARGGRRGGKRRDALYDRARPPAHPARCKALAVNQQRLAALGPPLPRRFVCARRGVPGGCVVSVGGGVVPPSTPHGSMRAVARHDALVIEEHCLRWPSGGVSMGLPRPDAMIYIYLTSSPSLCAASTPSSPSCPCGGAGTRPRESGRRRGGRRRAAMVGSGGLRRGAGGGAAWCATACVGVYVPHVYVHVSVMSASCQWGLYCTSCVRPRVGTVCAVSGWRRTGLWPADEG